MTSKFFLSFSLLFGAVSVNATPVFFTEGVPGLAHCYVSKLNAKGAILNSASRMVTKLNVGLAAVGMTAVAGLAGYEYMTAKQEVTSELKSEITLEVKPEVQKVQLEVTPEINSEGKSETSELKPATYWEVVKNSAYDAKVATVDAAQKAQTAIVNGYDAAQAYAMKNPYHVASGAVATAVLAYLAYAIYGSQEVATN